MKNLKIFLILLTLLICSLMASYTYSQIYPYTYWSKYYNAPSNLQDSAVAIASNPAGMLFVAGWSLGSSTSKDIACLRYNPDNGDTIWTKRVIGAEEDVVSAMACNNNAVYLTGWTFSGGNRNIITLKLNALTGDTMWVNRYNGPGSGGDYGLAIALDGSGNAYVCGRVGDVGNVSHYIVIKYDVNTGSFAANFPFIYNVGFASSADVANSITVDGSGNIYVTGKRIFNAVGDMMTLRLNSNGLLAWIKLFDGGNDDFGVSAKLDNTASSVYSGGWSFRAGVQDFVIIRYNALTGDSTGFASYNGTGNSTDLLTSMALDAGNNVYVTGISLNASSKYEIATLKYNSNLAQLWVKRTVNTAVNDLANHIMVGNANDVYVVGSSNLGNGQNYNYLTIRYNAATGDTIWTKRENGAGNGNDFGSQIAVMDSQHIYVTGSAVSSGSTSMYTLRYSNEIVGIRPISGEVPEVFSLYQNFPNPFNPSTTIRFDVPKTSIVKITIFDAAGREVDVIANKELTAGKYEAEWDASGHASGVYFFKFSAGDFSDTKKMMLVK